ncbi:MAG: PAS-domain containing protein [Pseudomonadota bacterium]
MTGTDQLGDDAAQAVESLLGPEVLRPGMGLFGAILSAVGTAACLIDPQDRVHAWNAKHTEFLSEHNDLIRRGLPYAQILENYFRHNSSETDPQRWRKIVDEAISRHRAMVEPSMFQKKDGRWLLVADLSLPRRLRLEDLDRQDPRAQPGRGHRILRAVDAVRLRHHLVRSRRKIPQRQQPRG